MCHDVLDGGAGFVGHNVVISDAGCVTCHGKYSPPNSGHIDCSNCHLETSPNIIIDGSKTPLGEADDLATSLGGAGYTFDPVDGLPRMTDFQADDLASGNFDPIACSVCHPSRTAPHLPAAEIVELLTKIKAPQ